LNGTPSTRAMRLQEVFDIASTQNASNSRQTACMSRRVAASAELLVSDVQQVDLNWRHTVTYTDRSCGNGQFRRRWRGLRL